MKRIMILLLTAALCLTLCACGDSSDKMRQPVHFYYRNAEVSYGSSEGVISAVTAESAGYDDTVEVLNAYLKGSDDNRFHSTFPPNTEVLDLHITGERAELRLNDALARYSGIDLTVACACLTMTTIDLTGVKSVTIAAASKTLDGAESVTMNLDSLMLLDLYIPEATEE